MPGSNSGLSKTRAKSLCKGRLGSEGIWIRDYGGVPRRPPFWRTLI